MRRGSGRFAGVFACLILCAPASRAQTPPPAPPPPAVPDPAFEAAKRAFDALPEAERRAIQDALVWTGDYKGVVDGVFGRGARAAIVAFAQRAGLPTDGTLDARGRALLANAAQGARAASGFATSRDPRSGASLGLPLRMLAKRAEAPSGSRWTSPDGAMSLETSAAPEAEGDLPGLFARLTEPTPNRRVTYKLLRPDFLVVSGEAGKSTFYTRAARGAANGAPTIRSYTFAYPAGVKNLDALSIAIANSFDPFPGPPAPPPASVAAAAPPPAPVVRPAAPVLAGTAVAVDPRRAVAHLPASCAEPRLGRAPARILRRDEASGLVLLESGAARPALSPVASPSAAGAEALVFFANSANGAAEIAVAPATIVEGAGGLRVAAALSETAPGAALFDRRGALVGVLGANRAPGVAGPAARATFRATWPLVTGPALASLVGEPGPAASPAAAAASAADVAARARGAVLPVFCGP